MNFSPPLVGLAAGQRMTFSEAAAEFATLELDLFRHQSDEHSEHVMVFRGDVVADSLDLDFDTTEPGAEVGLIIVTGDAQVRAWIANEQTDGAVSLAVCGDLRVVQVAIGGQELFVGGDLLVDGLFCGSYNHGHAEIRGNLTAGCVITDDYRVWVGGNLNAPVAAPGESLVFRGAGHQARRAMAHYLTYELALPLLLDQQFFDEVGIVFSSLREAIRQGPIVIPDASAATIPHLLALPELDDELGLTPSADRIAAVQSLAMFTDVVERFEAYDSDDFFRLVRPHVALDGVRTDGSAYAETGDEKFWFDRQGTECTVYRGRLGEPLKEIAANPTDPSWVGCAQVFARLIRYFLTLEEMQAQTPAGVVESLVEALIEDDEDEAEIGWFTLSRADQPDEDGEVANGTRLFVMNGYLSFTFEVTQGVCLRYIESDPDDQRYPIPVTHPLHHQHAVLHFQGATKFLNEVVAGRATDSPG